MATFKQFDLPFKTHLCIGFIVRILLIFYADYHDGVHEVPYTDIDYRVFTDAARYVVEGNSPYKRHTFRYSPIIAYLLIPNVLWYENFGRILFSFFDLLIAVAIRAIVKGNLMASNKVTSDIGFGLEKIAVYSSLCWLYNPLSVAISTRGNADSLPCFFIISSVFILQSDSLKGSFKYVLSGVALGVSIHLRLYPLAFSFPMYLSIGEYKINKRTSLIDAFKCLIPNRNQIALVVSCILTLAILTYSMYKLYGYEFLFETYIYHLFRTDTRHNFSVLFYYAYLKSGTDIFDYVKPFVQALECVVLFMISLTFGTVRETLSFALFAEAVVLVAYNSVMTSQYFIWFLSLLPLVVHDLTVTTGKAVVLASMWGLAQGAWLFYAYLLEFKSRQVFIFIWLKGVVFFCTNIYILSELINSYVPGYGYKRLRELFKKEKNY